MTTTAELRPEAPAGVLVAAKARRRAAYVARGDLRPSSWWKWVVTHPAESIHAAETHTLRGFGETDLPLAGEGAPSVAEFCVAEFAAVVGLPSGAGKRYVGEALELCHPLPRLWWRVTSGDLPAWKARVVARETIRFTPEAATFVDRHVAPVAHRVRTSQLDRLVAEAIGRFMPDEVERLAAQAAERRHVTVHDQQVSFSGTTYVEAELDLADGSTSRPRWRPAPVACRPRFDEPIDDDVPRPSATCPDVGCRSTSPPPTDPRLREDASGRAPRPPVRGCPPGRGSHRPSGAGPQPGHSRPDPRLVRQP